MHRTACVVTALVLSSVLLAAVPVGAAGDAQAPAGPHPRSREDADASGAEDAPEPVAYAAEDAAFHAEWAANDTEGFAENHTTNPHRDPLAHSLWLACWSADDAGAAVGPVAAACAPFYEATEPSPPVEEQEQDAEAGQDEGAEEAAAEAASSAGTLVEDVQDDPQGAPDHVASFLGRTLVWVEDHVLERVRDLVGSSVDVAGAGVDASLGAVDAVGDAGHHAADVSADASRSMASGVAGGVANSLDALTGAASYAVDGVVSAGTAVVDATAATVDASASLVGDVSTLAQDAFERVASLWSGDETASPEAPRDPKLPADADDASSLLEDVREQVPLDP